MQDDRLNAVQSEINMLNNLKRVLRNQEHSLDARNRALRTPGTFPANNVQGLRKGLLGNLPNYMMPGNVGGINEVTWPFYFNSDIDLGANPTISENTYFRGSFQVDQEAAFLMMSVSVAFNTDEAGQSALALAPLQVEFIDRQSSRRFNNAPMPIQMIGQNSCPTIFPVPMYIQPNAFIDIAINGLTTVELDLIGSGSLQFSFFGNRIRTENAGKVLSTIFAP